MYALKGKIVGYVPVENIFQPHKTPYQVRVETLRVHTLARVIINNDEIHLQSG